MRTQPPKIAQLPRRSIGLVIVGRLGNSSKRFLDGCTRRLIPKRSSRPRKQIIINLDGGAPLHMYILSELLYILSRRSVGTGPAQCLVRACPVRVDTSLRNLTPPPRESKNVRSTCVGSRLQCGSDRVHSCAPACHTFVIVGSSRHDLMGSGARFGVRPV